MPYSSGRVVHDADAHIMETPTWLRDHADPAIRDRIEPLALHERQRAAPDRRPRRAAARPRRRVRPAAPTSTAPTSTAPIEEAEIMLRKNFAGDRLVHRRGPAPRPRPARLLEPAACSTPSTTGACTTGSTAATSTSPTAPPAPTTGAWSSSARSTPACCPRCYVPLADFDRAAAHGRRGDRRWAPPRCWWRRAARPATRPATSASTRCGPGPRRPASRSCSTSAAPAT